jgi:hypothetical protein
MIEQLPDTTLFNETETGEIVATGTKVTFDQVVTAYDNMDSREGKLLTARVFAHDHNLTYGHVVTLFRFIRDLRGEDFWHEQLEAETSSDDDAIDDDYDYRPGYFEGFESDPDDAS